jgi:hypothetical protein
MKPDFIVIGAMKCGTSTVNAYFEDHPSVFMVRGTELRFFSHDEVFARGTDWYEAQFAGRTTETLCGEGTNDYASGQLHPLSAGRMAAYRPDLRIVYMVRHPVARIVSAWIQNRVDQGDQVPPTLDRAVRERAPLYVGQSLYWENLSRYRAVFPDSQIFVGFMEDMRADQAAFFARLCDFLGVPPAPAIRRGHVNPSSGKRVPGALYSRVNRLPLTRALKAVVPKPLRSLVKDRVLSSDAAQRPAFSPAVAAELADRLRPDAAALLAHCGKPPGFWKL